MDLAGEHGDAVEQPETEIAKSIWHLVWCCEAGSKASQMHRRGLIKDAVEEAQGTLLCIKKAQRFVSWLRSAEGQKHPVALIVDWREVTVDGLNGRLCEMQMAASTTVNILVEGEVGCGKSTVINQLLPDPTVPRPAVPRATWDNEYAFWEAFLAGKSPSLGSDAGQQAFPGLRRGRGRHYAPPPKARAARFCPPRLLCPRSRGGGGPR